MTRKFNDDFKKDDKGKRREWKDIPEEQIKEIFDSTKQKLTSIYDEFKKICLPTEITKMENDDVTPDGDDPQETF